MKLRGILTALAGAGMVLAVSPASPAGAAKGTVKVLLSGDCFDGKMVEGTDDDNCQIMVTVTPKSKNVNATLEVAYDEEDPEWEELDAGKTRGGRFIFYIPSVDEDDIWMDGVVMYRVRVKKASGLTMPKMREYKVEYVSAENADAEDTEMTDEEKADADAMDKAMNDNQRNIQQQQPNAPIYGQKPETGGWDKASAFNRACGTIGFPKDKCDKLVQTKTPLDAKKILGDQAEKWCAALSESFGRKAACDVVLPNAFPPVG